MKYVLFSAMLCTAAAAETRTAYLEDAAGDRTAIARVSIEEGGAYTVTMIDAPFADHFLSMRPFKCLESAEKHWCHVPYPYDLSRDVSDGLTDLEYDFLFLWKGATEYGINMWNGIYYRIAPEGDALVGTLHEIDMDLLSAPPAAGARPLRPADIHPADPDSHWLPRLVIE